MQTFSKILAGGALAAFVASAAAAEPRAFLLAQAQTVAPGAAQAQEDNARERRRAERRERREERRDDRRQNAQTPQQQQQQPQPAPQAPPPAQAQPKLPPVSLPTVAAPQTAAPPPAAPQAAAPQGAAPQAAPQSAQENDRDRRRGERRRDSAPSQARVTPAQPAPPAAAPQPAAPQAAAPQAAPQPGREDDRDRRRGERRRDTAPSQAQVTPAQPAPPAAAPAPAPAPAQPQARTTTQAPAAAPAAPAPAQAAPDTRRADRRDEFSRDESRRDEFRREEWRNRREEWRNRRLDDVREQRTTSRENGRTVIREPGRTIVRDGNRTIIRHDDTDRLRARARDVRVERRGSDTITTVIRPDGTRIVSVTDRYDRLVRRTSFDRAGREYLLIDNRARPSFGPPPVVYLPPPRIAIPRERYIVEAARAPMPMIIETLSAPPVEVIERPYSLDEIRQSVQVRDRMPRIDVDTITFETGSWMIEPSQAAKLEDIANAMKRIIDGNPAEMFLIEGHTDAVGGTIDNLSLSDRRAESVAVVLTDEFGVPPENLQTQGYGEELLKVQTEAASRENRRVAIRRITPLLSGTAQAVR